MTQRTPATAYQPIQEALKEKVVKSKHATKSLPSKSLSAKQAKRRAKRAKAKLTLMILRLN